MNVGDRDVDALFIWVIPRDSELLSEGLPEVEVLPELGLVQLAFGVPPDSRSHVFAVSSKMALRTEGNEIAELMAAALADWDDVMHFEGNI